MKTARILLLIVLPGLLVLFAPGRAFGQAPAHTYQVTKFVDTFDGRCDQDCSLREAIIAANDSPGHDLIVLKSGTYTLSRSGAGEDAGRSGDLDITDALTLAGNGATKTIIDAGELDRIFHIHQATQAVLRGISVQNGLADGPGGGILNEGDALLFRLHLTGNASTGEGRTGSGGGIYNAASMTILESEVFRNLPGLSGAGGGIANGGDLRVSKSLVRDNSTIDGSGGGISNLAGRLLLQDCQVRNNDAEGFSGGLENHGEAWVISSRINRNSAEFEGGGIFNRGSLFLFKADVTGNVPDNIFNTDDPGTNSFASDSRF